MSLMSSLYVGTSGLNVSQNALNTTSHNIVNVDTKGYVRQQVLVTDTKYQTIGYRGNNTLQVGIGTTTEKVMTYRDLFLDQSYRDNIGREGFYTAQYDACEEIENLLGETEGVAFQNNINELWTKLQEMAKDPGNIVTRSNFIQSGVSFLERANSIQSQLTTYQQSLNTNITTQVNQINTIGQQIDELNKKIVQYEAGGVERANDYRDQRDLLLDQLAEMVKINYSEDKKGVVSVNIEGTNFVTDSGVFNMALKKVNDSSDLLKPVWTHLKDQDVFNLSQDVVGDDGNDIGSLKGLLMARGDKEANYTDIPVKENFTVGGVFDETAYNQAVIEFNKSINASTIMVAQAQFDQLIHGIVSTINDVLCPNTTLPDGTVVLDTDKAPIGMDADKTVGSELFVRNYTDRYTKQTIDGKEYYVYNGEDPDDIATLYSVTQLSVNPEILANYSKLPLSSNNGSGEFDLEAVKELTTKWQDKFATLSPNTLTSFNITNYYTNFIGSIGNRGNQYKTIAASQSTTVDTIESQRQGVIGVSSDDELTNLIRFQHSYNASARYITAVNQMLEHLLNNL